MKKLILSSAFLVGTLGFAESKTTQGFVLGFHTQESNQLSIEGQAADVLFESLKSHPSALRGTCMGTPSFTVAPFVCLKPNGQAKCFTVLKRGQGSFSVPEICDGPNPSVIGIGNGKNGPSHLQQDDETLLETDEGLSEL